MDIYDVIIIGAGPGGLTAAIYGARAGMNVLLLERGVPGGQMMNTAEIENYPGFAMIHGQELSDKMYKHALELGAAYKYGEVKEINTISDTEHEVVCGGNKTYKGKAVIIASGATPRKVNVPGESELAGRGVSYCAICDGAFFKNKNLVVIGGGDSAVEEAVYLTKFADKVTVLHRREAFTAQKILQERLFRNDKIDVKFNAETQEIGGEEKVTHVRFLENGEPKEMAADGVFIYVGMQPITSFVQKELLNERGYIVTNEKMETAAKGIYAIGDVREKELRQVVTATNDGAIAIQNIEKFLSH